VTVFNPPIGQSALAISPLPAITTSASAAELRAKGDHSGDGPAKTQVVVVGIPVCGFPLVHLTRPGREKGVVEAVASLV
jgi:hypothetical protein